VNLFGLEVSEAVDRKEIAKRQLNNLLTSYADEADIFAEIIQNSFDAVQQAIRENLYTGNEQPEITVILGRRSEGAQYLCVCDNGVGMSPSVAVNLTIPGYSHGKRKGRTVGYKGVGASYFFAASRRIALRTRDRSGSVTAFSVTGSYDWIKGLDEREPVVTNTFEVPESVTAMFPNGRGTSVYFQFHDGIKPASLNNLVIQGEGDQTEVKNWASFLASKTALGSTAEHFEQNISLKIVLDRGDAPTIQAWTMGAFDRESNRMGYPFPHHVFKVSKDIREIDAIPQERMYQVANRYQAVHRRWTADEIIDGSNLESEEKERLRLYLKWVDGYLCYSTDVLKEVNKRLGGRGALIRHGMKISVDDCPQGRTLDLSLTSSQGLDRQAHIVLSFKGLELDTGRKISADEVVASGISKLGQRVIAVLKEYRWAMKKKDRPDVSSDLEQWRLDIDLRSQTSLIKQLFRKIAKPEIFRVDPGNEAEVIALFSALLTGGLIKGYKLRAISGFERYDSIVDIDVNSPEVSDLSDTLSVRNHEWNGAGEEKVLEFKHNFDELLQDFEDKVKSPTEIDVVVCWAVTALNVRRGRLEPTYGVWRDNRVNYAGTYIWRDENETATIPVVCLKNVVSELLTRLEQSSPDDVAIGTATLQQLEQADRDALV
jgi:hypothetical protein